MGIPPRGIKGLGITSVRGARRTPLPPLKIMARKGYLSRSFRGDHARVVEREYMGSRSELRNLRVGIGHGRRVKEGGLDAQSSAEAHNQMEFRGRSGGYGQDHFFHPIELRQGGQMVPVAQNLNAVQTPVPLLGIIIDESHRLIFNLLVFVEIPQAEFPGVSGAPD
jgi:hypothetical protein